MFHSEPPGPARGQPSKHPDALEGFGMSSAMAAGMTKPTEEADALAVRLAAVVDEVAEALERAALVDAIDAHNARIDAAGDVFESWFDDEAGPL